MKSLETLWHEGKKFLGVHMPIIAGAMTWISDSHFVSEVAKAGAFGSLAAGNMEPSLLEAEIKKVQELTDKFVEDIEKSLKAKEEEIMEV